MTVASGATLTLNGASIFGGFLRGPGAYAPINGTILAGGTTYASTTINSGVASFANFTNGGDLNVAAGLASPVTMNGFTNEGGGAIVVGAVSVVNVADFQTYGTLTLNPAAVGSNQQTLMTNTGSSAMFFNGGSRTFIGTPQTATSGGVSRLSWPG